MENKYYPFVTTPLPYADDALEPFLGRQTLSLHHDKHLGAYITNLNAQLAEEPRLQKLSLPELLQISRRLGGERGIQLCRNAGGVFNHRFYFQGMLPQAEPVEDQPQETVTAPAETPFIREVTSLLPTFIAAAQAVFGSGYAWIAADRRGRMRVLTTKNQDSLFSVYDGLYPVLCIDVWEHAYYLDYQNRRPDYCKNFSGWINWQAAEDAYRHRLDWA